jgi:hypothetical protein
MAGAAKTDAPSHIYAATANAQAVGPPAEEAPGRRSPAPRRLPVQGWLDRIVRALPAAGVPPDKRDDIAAAILTLFVFMPTPGLCRRVRASLLRLDAASLALCPRSKRCAVTVG